jgi:hypothetical protein
MLDPQVMGTLLIGLGAIDAEDQSPRRRRTHRARRPTTSMRSAIAQSLRRVAALLEPRTVDEVAV